MKHTTKISVGLCLCFAGYLITRLAFEESSSQPSSIAEKKMIIQAMHMSDEDEILERDTSWEERVRAVPRGPETFWFKAVNSWPDTSPQVVLLNTTDPTLEDFIEGGNLSIEITEKFLNYTAPLLVEVSITKEELQSKAASIVFQWRKGIQDMRLKFGERKVISPIDKSVVVAIPLVVPLIWKSFLCLESLWMQEVWPRSFSFAMGDVGSAQGLPFFLAFLFILRNEYMTGMPGVRWRLVAYRQNSFAWTGREIAANLDRSLDRNDGEEVVVFWDADDFMAPSRVRVMTRLFQQVPQLDVAVTSYQLLTINQTSASWSGAAEAIAATLNKPEVAVDEETFKLQVQRVTKNSDLYDRLVYQSSSFTSQGRTRQPLAVYGQFYLGSVLNEPGFPWNWMTENSGSMALNWELLRGNVSASALKPEAIFAVHNSTNFLRLLNSTSATSEWFALLAGKINVSNFLSLREVHDMHHVYHSDIYHSWAAWGCHNGWITARRRVLDLIPFPKHMRAGEDAMFLFRTIQSGLNTACFLTLPFGKEVGDGLTGFENGYYVRYHATKVEDFWKLL